MVRQWINSTTFAMETFLEPSFAQLNTTVIWVQFQNLSIECWEGETLETIVGNFGNLIKVN